MQELLKEGTYFSDEEMKKRSPYLFHHYVGQFITEREAQRLARDSEKSSWSEQLLSHMDHQVLRCALCKASKSHHFSGIHSEPCCTLHHGS